MALDLRGLSQQDQLQKAADYAGVDPSVFSGMSRIESSDGKHMLSPAGARGWFGIMPTTQKTWEARTGRQYNPDDYGDGLTLAALTLKENLENTGGNIPDALRMYNGGTDRSKWNNAETSAYAAKVLGHDDGQTSSAYSLRDRVGPSPDDAWEGSAYDLMDMNERNRSGSATKEYLSDVEKGVLSAAGTEAAVNAVLAGTDPTQAALDTRATVNANAPAVTDEVLGQLGKRPVGTGADTAGWESVIAAATAGEKEQTRVDAISAGDKFKAAFDQNTLTMGILHAIADSQVYEGASRSDPAFRQFYLDNIDKIEEGHNENEIDALREARNPIDLRRIQFHIQQDRDNMKTLTDGSSSWGVMGYSLAGGVADPAGWLAGLGVGKVAQVVGVGARAAFAAGRAGRGLLYAAGEGATGNLLITASLDALGQHESASDYAMAGGMGLAFGAAFSTLGATKAARLHGKMELEELANRVQTGSAEQTADTFTKAQAAAGPNATAETVAQAADNVEAKTAQAMRDHLDATRVPESEQLPVGTDPDVAQTKAEATTTETPAASGQEGTYELPRDLGGATPNYSYGDKKFKLKFANDVDKAAYIIAQTKPSARDADYLQFVMAATGADEAGARAYGQAVRAAIKDQAKAAKPGTLEVESLFNPKPKESAATNNGSGESAASIEAQNRLRDEKAAGQTRMLIDRDGSVRELSGVDAVDTHARAGQVIVQRGIGKDEWTVLSHGDDIGKDAVQGKVAAARARMSQHTIADDAELPVGEHFLDMDDPAYDEPGAVFSRQEQPSASVEGELPRAAAATETPNVQPENPIQRTQLGDLSQNDLLFPRGGVNDPSVKPRPMGTTDAMLDREAVRLGLDMEISDEAERRVVTELALNAERLLKERNIDPARLKPAVAKVGWEATSTALLNGKSDIGKAFAVLGLESPEGVAGRHVTAAVTKHQLEKRYIGTALRDYHNAYRVWRNGKGGSALRDFFDNRLMREFDDEVFYARERRFQGKAATESREVSLAADVLDKTYNKMRSDQKYVQTVGSARLSDTDVSGYGPRRLAAGFVASLEGKAKRAYLNLLSSEFRKTAEFTPEFADRFAVKYLERAKDRAKGAYDVPGTLHDPESADMITDTLKGMGMSMEQIGVIMGKFSRGGAAHTKARIDMDLTTQLSDGEGGNIMVGDLMNRNNIQLLRSYARRVSGEVALAKYGVMGKPGLNLIRKGMQAQGATGHELSAFDQVAAEFLGQPFGNHIGKWADNARTLVSALKLGGMGFTQFGEYANGIAAIGVVRVAKSITAIPRLLSEVHALANGKPKANSLLGSLEAHGIDFGTEGYNMRGMYDVDDGFDVHGKEALTTVDKMIRAGAHMNRIASMHRSIMAVQVRGMAEQIVLKSLRYMREGINDAALKDMGITDDVMAAMRQDINHIAKFNAAGEATSFDITKMRDTSAANKYMIAVQRGASQIIQETFIGETGKWAHDGWLKLMTQFRTFGITATQKQWGRQSYTHGTAKALGYLLGSMSIAVPIHMARVQLNSIGRADRDDYLARNLSPLALGRAAMNYVSAIGVLPDVLDIASSAVGLPVTGGRYGNKTDFIGGQIMPAAGVVNDIYNAAQQAGGTVGRAIRGEDLQLRKSTHDTMKLLPGGNLPYLQAAINQLDD